MPVYHLYVMFWERKLYHHVPKNLRCPQQSQKMISVLKQIKIMKCYSLISISLFPRMGGSVKPVPISPLEQESDRAFIEKPGGFGDHPTDRVTIHLNSKRHLEAVKNKQASKELQQKHTSVHQLLSFYPSYSNQS